MTIDTILLKVASRCNIDCQYCYVYHAVDQGWRRQPRRMSEQTIDGVISRVSETKSHQRKPLSVLLHGGEPLLLGKTRLRKLLLGLRSGLGDESTISLQTNGILLDNEIVELLAESRTTVGVSIDGPEQVNDKFRVDHRGRSTFSRTLQGIETLCAHPQGSELFRGVLAVIDPKSSPESVYRFFKNLNVPSVDFLFRDGNHETLPYGKRSFSSTEYGNWLSRIWNLYIDDPDPTPIEMLDNLVRLMFGKESAREGSGLTDFGILVIETDGGITKNDTLKFSFDGADRFTENWSVHRNSIMKVANSEEFKRYRAEQRTTNRICLNCRFFSVCGGGMVLHRWSKETEYDNPSVYCKDQQLVYTRIEHSFRQIIA